MKKTGLTVLLSIILALIVYELFFDSKMLLDSEKKMIVRIGNQRVESEVVSDDRDLATGLGGRNMICESCGMLFVFPQKGQHVFWMKGMLFPLDIIWISDGKVAYIKENVAKDDMNLLDSRTTSEQVLEVNAGFCDKFEIKKGDPVHFEKIK